MRTATKISTADRVARGTSFNSPATGIDQDDNGGRAEARDLGLAARAGHRRGARRAGVDGEGAKQPGHHAARTHADEVTSHVDVVSPLVGEGAGGGGRLAHDHESDDHRDGKHAAE